MNKPLLVSGIVVAILFHGAYAQETASEPLDKEPLPPGPLIVTSMPAFAQWSIDFTYPSAAKPGQPGVADASGTPGKNDTPPSTPGRARPLRIVVTKTGDVTHEERVFEGGLTGELWTNHDIAAERLPYSSALVAGFGSSQASHPFPDFDWISPENYVGVQKHDQVRCLVFREPQYGIEHSFLGIATAYIDKASRYPVEYERNSQTRIYIIRKQPVDQLVIPADFLAAGQAVKDRLEKATPHLALP